MNDKGTTLFYPSERIAIFVDGANFYGAAKGLQFDIDYRRMLELFAKKGVLVRAYYYTAMLDEQEFSPLRPLVDWLGYNGWMVVTKLSKEFTDSNGRVRRKGDMDVDIAVDILDMADKIDHIVLISGDGDFRPLVESVQRRGKRVTVISTIKTDPPMCADELRRQADNFIELADIRNSIERLEKTGPRAVMPVGSVI